MILKNSGLGPQRRYFAEILAFATLGLIRCADQHPVFYHLESFLPAAECTEEPLELSSELRYVM